jgi:hypothetical protein
MSIVDDVAARQRHLLGWGLACPPISPGADLGRDIVLLVAAVDAATVSGFDNLAQSLQIALTTALGADPFNVAFGFDGVNAMADGTDAMLTRERVRVAIVQTLTRDQRVRRIIDLKILDGRLDPQQGVDQTLSPDERVEQWRRLAVDVAFEAVSGEQLNLNLAGVMPRG